MTAPGDAVEVSEHVVLAADGSRARPYAPAETTDGIAITRIRIDGPPYAMRHRVLRGETIVASSPPDWVMTSAEPEWPVVDIVYPRGSPSGVAVEVAQSAALGVLVPLGLPVHTTDLVAHWAGPVPGPVDGALAVVTVTAPSGALVTTAHWQSGSETGAATSGGDFGPDIRPAGESTDLRVLAAGCEIYGGPTGTLVDEVLVVLAPPSVTALRAYDARGRFLADLPAPEDGVLTGAAPPGTAEIEAETAGGILLGRTGLLGRDNLWDRPRRATRGRGSHHPPDLRGTTRPASTSLAGAS